MSQSRLIELSYFDPTQSVRLTVYADTMEMSRNVQSGNTQNLKPVRLPAASAPTLCTLRVAAPAGCAYRS